jgi:outer membrane lipoprotein SlyB
MKKLIASLFVLCSSDLLAQTYVDQIQVLRIEPKIVHTYMRQCTQISSPSDNSGVGTVLGGIAGGIIGNQVGRGDGNTAATVAGAVIGGMVGNRIGQDQANNEIRQQCTNVPVPRQVGEIVTILYKNKVYRFEAQ